MELSVSIRSGAITLLLAALLPSAAFGQTQATLTSARTRRARSNAPSSPSGASLAPGSHLHTFHDPTYKVSFDYPADWTFARKDHEISTFHLDARSAPRNSNMRAVAAIPENPFPTSTFSGAYIYLSVTPHSSNTSCARQATGHARSTREIGGVPFVHGHDEQKQICTVERDDIYTTYRHGMCYRFDLAMNNFCGGEVSGVRDVTDEELENVRSRLESILNTVRFDPR